MKLTHREWLKQKIEDLKQQPLLPEECIEWPFAKIWTGHGFVMFKKRNGKYAHHGVHRLAFEWYYGRKPTGRILHTCDNAPCYNPAHLYEGTQKQNMRDKYQRSDPGRCGRRLTEDVVREIIAQLRAGLSQPKIASQFGVSIPTISMIKNGHTWKHIPR